MKTANFGITRQSRPGSLDGEPGGRTVEVLHLQDGRLQRVALLAEGVLKPREFPHVQVDIDQIWPD